MRPCHLLQVSFTCKRFAVHVAGHSRLFLAAMASNFQFVHGSPVSSPSNVEIVEEGEALSPCSRPQSEKPAKPGCCGCIRKRNTRSVDANSKASRAAHLKRAPRARIILFLRYTWIDTLILCISGIVVLCLYWAPNNLRNPLVIPIWPRSPVNGSPGGMSLDLGTPTEFQYPWQKSPLNDIVCAVIITIVPIVVIGLFQLKIHSCWDFHAGQMGILKAVTTT